MSWFRNVSRKHIKIPCVSHLTQFHVVLTCQVNWFPRHHGMARPPVADGGEGLQIRRVAANILNKQSRTADRGWSYSSCVGQGRTTAQYEPACYEMLHRALLRRDFVAALMNVRAPCNMGNFQLTSWATNSFSRRCLLWGVDCFYICR
jgi:hypothetical protein